MTPFSGGAALKIRNLLLVNLRGTGSSTRTIGAGSFIRFETLAVA